MNAAAGLADLLPLFRELNNLKRIRVAGCPGSLAQRLFAGAWYELLEGEDLEKIALETTARAVVATRLGGVDANILSDGGLPMAAIRQVLEHAFDTAGPIEPGLAAGLRAALIPPPGPPRGSAMEQSWITRLTRQPRAGATRPGHPRIVLEPAENHAEHCGIVAVSGVLAAGYLGADPAVPFLTGLSHHLHNVYLPDAGDAGDTLLGEHLAPLMGTFRNRVLAELPSPLRKRVRDSLEAVYRADNPEARAFQAADSLDRVLEMEWHARCASFTLDVALGDMDIIHPGPVQAFQLEVMRAVGWK